MICTSSFCKHGARREFPCGKPHGVPTAVQQQLLDCCTQMCKHATRLCGTTQEKCHGYVARHQHYQYDPNLQRREFGLEADAH